MSNLRDKRKGSGLSQAELAFMSKVSVRLIQDYEQGHKDINKAASITVYKLAKTLYCNMEDLLELEKEVDL